MGDENVVLAWVDDEVGWGIFAAKDFAQGNGPAHIGAGTRPHLHCADADESRICARKGFPLPAWNDAVCVAVWAARLGWVGLGWVGLGWDELGWDGLGWVGTADGIYRGRRVHLDDRRRRARAVDDQADAGAFSVTAARYPQRPHVCP